MDRRGVWDVGSPKILEGSVILYSSSKAQATFLLWLKNGDAVPADVEEHRTMPHRPFALAIDCQYQTARTPGPCSTTSGTRIFNTRCAIPSYRRIGSRTFGIKRTRRLNGPEFFRAFFIDEGSDCSAAFPANLSYAAVAPGKGAGISDTLLSPWAGRASRHSQR
jgi:hypothetical protein